MVQMQSLAVSQLQAELLSWQVLFPHHLLYLTTRFMCRKKMGSQA